MSSHTITDQDGDGDLTTYALEDRYQRTQGRVYLNGSQALVRLPLMQRQLDEAQGLNTAGFISGYTGSPLGGYDTALKQASDHLAANHIHFQPGINEDLGATAVWGSQQLDIVGEARYDGVFSLWYGKGPGVDRSGDALKHGSYSGASRFGGTLVLAGDDHGAKSSTTAHQSDHAFVHFGMPYLNPANVQEYLDFGLAGFALSRFSGCWVGMKCVTDTVESSSSVDVSPNRFKAVIPSDFVMPEGGLNAREGLTAQASEVRQYQHRLPAAQAFVRANALDKTVVACEQGKLGIVTTGKAYLDVMQALDGLGLDLSACSQLGIGIYKVAMPWPLEPVNISEFVGCYDEVLVIEEKRPVIEEQLASLLVNQHNRPLLTGKVDEAGKPLVSSTGELNPQGLSQIIAARLQRLIPGCEKQFDLSVVTDQTGAMVGQSLNRLPSFCAGCPHNTSTKVPEGSMAFGGIGCHGMATFLPERNTPTLFQMGGEGASWIGMAPFTEREHLFQNIGDGTYYHSGLLAIRAAVAAKVNITYKILVNDAIAMTGGQQIEGQMRVDVLSRQLEAEGVRRIALVANDPSQYRSHDSGFADNVTLHHRDELDRVQKSLRDYKGVTAIIYDQYCATELRRRRKRGSAEDPDQRIFINSRVCEGCGDCSVQSNCIAIEPEDTPYGRKRRINQSVCNKDFSCVKGYCPSFISVFGGKLRKRGVTNGRGVAGVDILQRVSALPQPERMDSRVPYSVLITGIGGSGVVTLGALIGMAAFLEGRGCSVLDVAGLAQRNGPVTSHIRVAEDQSSIHATRITTADLVIGCDIVVAAGKDVLQKMRPGQTRAVINRCVAPTSDFASNPDLDLSADGMIASITDVTDDRQAQFVAAASLATALMGNEVATNMFLVGFALQKGWLPVGLAAIERAIELNGVAVSMNKASLAWGRLAAVDLSEVEKAASPDAVEPQAVAVFDPRAAFDEALEHRYQELIAYQNRAYADRYRQLMEEVQAADRKLGSEGSRLSEAVASNYFKLLAYKDEYEVARLHSSSELQQALAETFEGDFKLAFHLAPPVLSGRDPHTGRYPKRVFGSWILPVFRCLAGLRFLRGSVFDPFGYAKHRRLERRLAADYADTLRSLLPTLAPHNYSVAVAIAALPEKIRGYDTVKEASIEQANAQQRRLLAQYHELSATEPRIAAGHNIVENID
ncbi:indolepyruvate ferredoxin oxidoreductase family protein [Spongiibacter marinus]|uniref:indolepyruvate ferredoxin oxidoreductase family protein n=1 Tax=Spongiibacter marinus TaxID=354246 RepID=UPI001960238B|nr:indolepyruvate ferredoxin oxidoreductase family protein [Spongiibacter marinus]MBM7422952.1 indolepyruvate ferredoxin oxidoreductase [Spongiibacter marinus]